MITAKIEVDDICNLILKDTRFPIASHDFKVIGIKSIRIVMNKEEKDEIKKWLGRGEKCIKLALKNHSLFRDKVIPGNPCLIIRYATLYNNQHSKVNTLVQIYEKAKSKQELDENGDDAKSCYTTRFKHSRVSKSLWDCTKEGVHLLQELHPECYSLLQLLGCLPVGIHKFDLPTLLGKDQERELVQQQFETLKSFSFIELHSDRIQANSYLIDYFEAELTADILTSKMNVIHTFYLKFLEIYYECNSVMLEDKEVEMPHRSFTEMILTKSMGRR